ncbi:hypothetical protein FJY93_03770 [Candidatus Kaiserbacteria bacterium]|nr:hypothetical protein [Candidatus Kaiserbacteria bacterium]
MTSLTKPLAWSTSVLLLTNILVPSFVHAQSAACPHTWDQNLKIGSTGADVRLLQEFLNQDTDTAIALSGPGSRGNETASYGSLTARAVSKFQEKYRSEILSPLGLSLGTGSVGLATRAKLNALCTLDSSAQATSTTATTGHDMLTVTKPPQPAMTLAPAGAGGVPFTTFTLTAGSADVTVHNVTVERTGPGMDNVFESVVLIDEDGEEVGDERRFHSDHRATLGSEVVIPARESVTFTVLGNITDDTTSYAGQTPIIQLISISASSPISGNLPLAGTAQIINDTLTIGSASASLSFYDPGTNANRYINETGIRFSGIRITANSKEDLALSSITWDQAGTAGSADLTNTATIIDDVSYPTENDGKSYTSTFSPAIKIPRGQTIDAYIQGSLTTTGSRRTVKFDIRSSDDVALSGETFGFGVGIAAAGNTASTGNSVFITSDGTEDGDEGLPFFSGSVATINGASVVSIGKN